MPDDLTAAERRPSFFDRYADSIAWVCLLAAMVSIEVSVVRLERRAAEALAPVSAPSAVPSTARGPEIEMASEAGEEGEADAE